MNAKILIKHLLLLCFLAMVFSGCKYYSALDLNVSRVESLYAPDNGGSYELDPVGENVTFLWSEAIAADGGLVVYEVVFDRSDGDFSHPVYRITADDKGVKNSAAVTHKQLNKAAAAAGAKASETITLKWSVASSKGDGVTVSQESRSITVKRLSGFADIPPQLFMAGEGSENQQEFTSVADGEFEIFTRLKGGASFSFADGISGASQSYSAENGVLVMDGVSTVAEDGVYTIRLDFNSASVSISKIESFGVLSTALNGLMFTLEYTGLGVWKATNATVVLVQYDWGIEDRYKFEILYQDNSKEWYGSLQMDNNEPNASTLESYFRLYPQTDPAPWNYTYKFNHGLGDAKINMTVKMQANSAYVHTIELAEAGEEEEEQKVIPTRLYMNGAGAESEQQFTQLSPGVFEVYTLLKAHTNFNFVDALTGDEITTYSAKNGALVEGASSQIVTESPYRITVDFNTETVTMAMITRIELFFPMTNNAIGIFTYNAKGEWNATGINVNLQHERYEDRYKFRFVVNGGFEEWEEWYGSSNMNNNVPGSNPNPNYFYVFPDVSNSGVWNYTYKFNSDLDQKTIDVSLQMNGNNYTHEITNVY